MESSGLRLRKTEAPGDSEAADFNRGRAEGLDERTLAKLLAGAPTVTACFYRANEFLGFLLERLAAIAPLLIPLAMLPLVIALIMELAFPETGNSHFLTSKPLDNKRSLQLVFLVVIACHSLIFFAVVLDYSKVNRISKESLENGRQMRDARHRMTTSSMPSLKANTRQFFKKLIKGKMDISGLGSSDSHALELDLNESNFAVVPSVAQAEETAANWWETYTLLRLILHCTISLLQQSARNFMSRLGSRHKLAARHMQTIVNSRHGHYLLRGLMSSSVKLLLLCLLIVIALVTLTLVKGLRQRGSESTGDWLIKSGMWNVSLACFLQLHFLSMLAVALLVSSSPSNIRVVGLLGRWLLTLLMCLTLQLAVMSRLDPLPKCLVNQRQDSGVLAVFTNLIDGYADSPIVNSSGVSRSKLLLVLSSLATAITASVLYQFNIIQVSLGSLGSILEWVFSISPVESLALFMNLFAAQSNFIILIMPFLGKLSESELFSIFVLMLVRTPHEGDEFWNFNLHGADQAMHSDDLVLQTYIPQRVAIRTLLSFPLILLFSRIIYPQCGKFGTRASVFRRLQALQCGRPFATLHESLLHFATYCTRSLGRYYLMLAFLYCMEFLIKFLMQAIDFQVKGVALMDKMMQRLITIPVTLLTDMTDVYPSHTHQLSYYIAYRFVYPKTTFQQFFIDGLTEKAAASQDKLLALFNSMATPVKEIVASGSLTWETMLIFVAFTSDCLHTTRRSKVAFLVRGGIAGVLVYSAMHNLLLLTCEPQVLRNYHNITAQWIETLSQHARIRNVSTSCTED